MKSIVNAHKRVVDWHSRAVEKAKDSQTVRMAVAIGAAWYTAGATSSWFTSWASESAFATSAFASESLAYAYGAQTAIYVGAGVVGGAAAGATAGGILCGSNCVRQGAQGGAISGGIFAGANLISQDWNRFGQITTRASAGGVSANLQGGDFRTGFIYEGATATASWGYQKVVGIMATPEAGKEIPGGKYDPNALGQPPEGYNVFGNNERLTGSFFGDFFTQGGAFSVVANQVPGANAVAYFHDTWMNQLGSSFNAFTNYSTMPAAAALSYGALLDGPLSVQLAVDRSR